MERMRRRGRVERRRGSRWRRGVEWDGAGRRRRRRKRRRSGGRLDERHLIPPFRSERSPVRPLRERWRVQHQRVAKGGDVRRRCRRRGRRGRYGYDRRRLSSEPLRRCLRKRAVAGHVGGRRVRCGGVWALWLYVGKAGRWRRRRRGGSRGRRLTRAAARRFATARAKTRVPTWQTASCCAGGRRWR